MKRIVSLVLALSMVLSMFATAFAGTTFSDVEGKDYESAVSALVELGIVEGVGNGTYEPERTVTRAEMAKFLVAASGMKVEADSCKGQTKFNDVDYAGKHEWATGYINLAADYGYIIGYPDGRFAPDAPVKYSEAVTMAIRALGYDVLVSAKGTWPVNYIQKANELNLLEDITYTNYENGANRGDIAFLIWNMLGTKMWDFTSQNETNGLTSSNVGTSTMLEKYFEDYTYTTVLFESVKINDKLEVLVTLDDDSDLLDEKNTLDKKDETYKYLENDFYTFVPGTEVEVLVNEDTKTLLTIVPTGSKELVEGTKVDIDEKYEAISGDTYSYAYATVDGNEIDASRQLVVESDYIYDINTKASTKYVQFNADSNFTIKYEDAEETLFIIDGVATKIKDAKDVTDNIELGSVLSKVSIKGTNVEFYMVTTPEEAEGKLTEVVEKEYKDSAVEGTYLVAKVGENNYSMLDTAVFFEDPEDFKAKNIDTLDGHYHEDMNGEEVVIKLDFLNRIVAFEFDGNIGDETGDISVEFFVIASNVDVVSRQYVIDLENENGKETYVFDKSYAAGKTMYADTETNYIGTFCAVTFDDDGEIEKIQLFGNADKENDDNDTEVVYDEEENKKYSVTRVNNAKFDDDKMNVSGDEMKIGVDKDVIIVTLLVDDDEEEPEYSYDITEGTDAIAKLNGEDIIIVKDAATKFSKAKYIVLYDTVSNKEDDLFVVVDTVEPNFVGGLKLTGKDSKTLDGKFYVEGNQTALTEEELEKYVAILYSVEEKVKDNKVERKYTIIAGFEEHTLAADYTNHAYIAESEKGDNTNGREAELIVAGSPMNINLDELVDEYEDTKIIVLNVSRNKDTDEYEATSYYEEDITTVELEELDRISFIPFGGSYDVEGNTVPDTVVILRGYVADPQ